MIPQPRYVFAAIWLGWAVSWLLAARWSAPTEKSAATWSVNLQRALALVGGLLIWNRTADSLGLHGMWDVGYDGAYLLAALTLGGCLFAWWARFHLGRLWSGSLTRKEDHRIVDSGPYAIVRHPIYAGLLGAALATAVAAATATAVAGWGLIAFAMWSKARTEERFLAEELGPAYEEYRQQVPMLLPILR